ncbi:DNA-binding transcriptional regulator, MocR family / aminotransferase domain [hydrothermal vent metagenome]|uniref:DNA-binding transcriptional regulator, MocR family / aminotransferase domain n=1 Tax=hydrothermal vent metagenome TaxID=652676 RepID=A0A3B0WNU6_9ZZZZ
MLITLDKSSDTPLTEQIITGIKMLIDNRALRHNMRMPSIRTFSSVHAISRFTTVQAFDRLVAAGYLQSRLGSGFYVLSQSIQTHNTDTPVKLERAMDVLWLLRQTLSQPSNSLQPVPGAGWLPHDWMDTTGIQKSLRNLAQKPARYLTQYGSPQGYLPLRQQLQQRLGEYQVNANENQILLTMGATHALDLIARFYISPGDTVLVDDPGYFILFGTLKSYGANVVGVPWKKDGPDIEKLSALIKQHKPKLFFTNTILHNPTGASISQAVAYRLLALAEQAKMLIIEDDVFGDFQPTIMSRLATLDQLNRVIYISSFSKTISASMRVGFIAGSAPIIQQLTDVKLLSGITTSEINERMVFQMLANGQYRKHLKKLHNKLQQAREQALNNFEQLKLAPYLEPQGGMFLWVKMPAQVSIIELTNQAAKQNIMLAPGSLFKPHQEPSEWMRFNVASCNEKLHLEFIKRYLKNA